MTGVYFSPDKTKDYGYSPVNSNTNSTTETFFPKEKVSPDASDVLNIGTIYDPATHINYGIRAEYAPNSTPDDPVINVTVQKGGGQTETHAVRIHDINTMNATDLEMFALCAYADDMGFGTGGTFGSWQTLKTYSENAALNGYGSAAGASTQDFATQKKNWNETVARMTNDYANAGMYEQVLNGKALLNMFDAASKENSAGVMDWRTMSCASWDKLLKNVDDFIDAYRERLKAMQAAQLKAAQKAARLAPASHQAAAAQAAWSMAAVMSAVAPQSTDTDIPAVAAAAAYAQSQPQAEPSADSSSEANATAAAGIGGTAAPDPLTKYQEYLLTGNITPGITGTDSTTEVADTGGSEGKKTWYITVFTPDGITCQACTPGEGNELLWQINYKNAGEYEKVRNFLKRFDQDEDLTFASNEKFWKDFLDDKINANTFYNFFEHSVNGSFDSGRSDGDSLYVDETKAAYSAYMAPSFFHESAYSMVSLLTGESMNIYKSSDYSENNPVYTVMGKDDKGNTYEREINVNEVDVHHCSYLEFMALNAHLYDGHMTAETQLAFVVMQQAGGASSDTRMDYAAAVSQLADQSAPGSKNGYTKIYQNWLERLSQFETDGQIQAADKTSAVFKTKENFFNRDDLLDNVAPNAPEAVLKAWQEAAREAGVDGLGRTADGKLSHISQMMAKQAIRWYHDVPEFNDLMGNDIASAIQAAQQALTALNNPLEPAAVKSREVQEQLQKERKFYEQFIDKLSPLL